MPGVARASDTISHGGSILTPNQTIAKADGLLIARVGDPVTCSVHGAQNISSGSTSVSIAGAKVARVGDSISCGATINSGSSNVMAD